MSAEDAVADDGVAGAVVLAGWLKRRLLGVVHFFAISLKGGMLA